MLNVGMPMQTWPTYIQVIRDEVRDGVGIFGEDDELRELIQECFERGDPLMGTVLWSNGWDHSEAESSHLTRQIDAVLMPAVNDSMMP